MIAERRISMCSTLAMLICSGPVMAEEIVRHALPGGSAFPIASAVEVPAGAVTLYHSGVTPRPADPDADPASRDFYGDTQMQSMSVFRRLDESLDSMGYELGDIVKMTVFLVGDPALDGKMDFAGFMAAYERFFGTPTQPNLPARSAVQIAGLVDDRMFVEVEVVAVRTAP